ncbi:twin-arginine translocation signal domain-containing protein [Ramlibacter sp.]|uniref:twin-arginine translocation signal domain-containing protein n=1 Tax=Ramlibacter sp. TaxID=1917967 RepID=UPI003D0C7C05
MESKSPTASRRGFMWGAAAAGAAGAAVVALPKVQQAVEQTQAAEATPKPERGGGYRLSEHVAHYYKTTRL